MILHFALALAATVMPAAMEDWREIQLNRDGRLFVDMDSIREVEGRKHFMVRLEFDDNPGKLFMEVTMDCQTLASEGLNMRAEVNGKVVREETFPEAARPKFNTESGKTDPMYVMICKP